jgi:hypothetical protein
MYYGPSTWSPKIVIYMFPIRYGMLGYVVNISYISYEYYI